MRRQLLDVVLELVAMTAGDKRRMLCWDGDFADNAGKPKREGCLLQVGWARLSWWMMKVRWKEMRGWMGGEECSGEERCPKQGEWGSGNEDGEGGQIARLREKRGKRAK